MTTAMAVAPAKSYCSNLVTISSGAISDFIGMLPAMKITDPYSPTARAKLEREPGEQRRPQRRQDDACEGL